jgi:sugar phosphate permease
MSDTPNTVAPDSNESKLTQWRYRIFASTWLCYAGMYFCRKPFSVVKGPMGEEFGWDATFLGMLGAVYLITYAIGQFLSGAAGTVLGPRRVLLIGMGGSVIANVVFGFTDSKVTFAIFLGLLGFAQSTGWGNTVGSMATWFHKSERGRVMGIWATCYQVGGVGATLLASKMLGAYGFQYSFFAGSVVMLAVMAFFALNHHNRPEEVGLSLESDENDPQKAPAGSSLSIKEHFQELGWDFETKLTIAIVGLYYFFGKFIRYAIWSWVPYLLLKNYNMSGEDSGYMSILFDFFGIAGVIIAGFISDKYLNSRRTGVSIVFLIGMFLACILLYTLGTNSIIIFGISISLIGFFLYGPDALMTGAQDIGNERGATLSAGIINGLGSIGAVAQELIIGNMYDKSGGDVGPIFMLLVGSAFAAVFCLMILRVTKLSDV